MIESNYKELFFETSNNKRIIIDTPDGSLENVDIFTQSLTLTETLVSGELKFGVGEASELKFNLKGVYTSLKGKSITASFVVGTFPAFKLGTYKVVSDKPNADRSYREVIAYDALYDVLKMDVASWYNGLAFPMSLKAFRNSFANYVGLSQASQTLVNDSITINKGIDPQKLSGKEVLDAICEVNGVFGHIGRDGMFHYIMLPQIVDGLYPSDTLYPSDSLFPRDVNGGIYTSSQRIQCAYEDYVCKPISRVQIRTNEGDIGAVVGNAGNDYVVEGNFLCFGMDNSALSGVASTLLNAVKHITYRPFNGTFLGNPCIEVGDTLTTQGKYEIVKSYILKRVLKGVQGLRDTFSATGEEYRTEVVNGVNSSYMALLGKTNELIRTVDETRSTLTDTDKQLRSVISQTAGEIRTEITNTESGLNSKISQTASSIYSEISSVESGLSSRISQTEREISAQASAVSVIADSLSLKADRTEIQGFVTFSDLSGGNTTIDGSCIKTGTIDADRISVKDIKISTAQVTSGTFDSARIPNLSAGKITTGTLSADRIDVKGIVDKFNSMDLACDELTANSRVSTSQLYASYIEGKQPHWEEYGSLKNSDYVLCGY